MNLKLHFSTLALTAMFFCAAPAEATPLGPSSGFLPTYVGPQNGDFEITSGEAFLKGSNFVFDATFNAPIDRTDRAHVGSGTVTIASAPPSALALAGVERVGGGESSPAVYSIKGEKSRAYTVSFLSSSVASIPGGYRVSNFTLWSANSGAITSGGVGHLNAMGIDTLRVGATMTVPAGLRSASITAVVPITILAQ